MLCYTIQVSRCYATQVSRGVLCIGYTYTQEVIIGFPARAAVLRICPYACMSGPDTAYALGDSILLLQPRQQATNTLRSGLVRPVQHLTA